MDGNRIVNATCDAHFGEQSDDFISPGHTDRIDVIHMTGVISHKRRYQELDSLYGLVVSRRMRAAQLVPSFQVLELYSKHGRLDAVHPGIPANHGVMILMDLTVVP